MHYFRKRAIPIIWVLYGWLVIVAVLIGATLNNTKPYKGDESFYITSAVEMIDSGNFLEPEYFGKQRLQKPILPYWITVSGYLMFGISLWSGRLPFLVISLMLLLFLFYFTRYIVKDEKYALLSVTMLTSSLLFLGFCRHAMCDLPFTFFLMISICSFYLGIEQGSKRKRWYILGYVSSAFACLSKYLLGAAPMVALFAYILISRPDNWKTHLRKMFHPLYVFIFLLILLPWYIYIGVRNPDVFIAQSGNETAALFVSPMQFVSNGVYYLLVLVRFFLPFSVLAVYLLKKRSIQFPQHMKLLFWFILIILTVFILFIDRQRERYLLILFPVLSIVMAIIFEKARMFRPLFTVSIIVFCIEVAGFIIYPYVAGEQVKDLVTYWQNNTTGTMSLASIPRKKISWAQALSHGAVTIDTNTTDYIITGDDGLGLYPDYHIIYESEHASGIVFSDQKIRLEKERYYLLGKNSNCEVTND